MLRRFLILCISPVKYDSLLKVALSLTLLLAVYLFHTIYPIAGPDFQTTVWLGLMGSIGLSMASFFSALEDWQIYR